MTVPPLVAELESVRPLRAMQQLFHFDFYRGRRRKKPRGALRHAQRAVADPQPFSRVLSPEDQFHHWHQHLDWAGLGDCGPRVRLVFLEGYARLFRPLAI